MKIVLVQIRAETSTRLEEHATFARACGLSPDDVQVVNALSGQFPPFNRASSNGTSSNGTSSKGISAVLIGGASGFSAYEDYEWTRGLMAFVERCYQEEMPLFGSCWGHQFIARALGGSVAHDALRAEMGTKTIQLTEAGQQDALFGTMPPVFRGNHGHHDRVTSLPSEAIELAYNETSPFQAFRIAGKPIYGTQFHPELDKMTITNRLKLYRTYYPESGDDEAFEALLASFQDTPDASSLLRRFLALFC